MPDGLLPRRFAIDVLKRQRHFDQFLFVSHHLELETQIVEQLGFGWSVMLLHR